MSRNTMIVALAIYFAVQFGSLSDAQAFQSEKNNNNPMEATMQFHGKISIFIQARVGDNGV